MEHTFKSNRNTDGSTTLWYSSHGYLMKVVRYEAAELETYSDDDESLKLVFQRDSEIFLRGFRLAS